MNKEYKIGDLVLWNGDETQTALILKIGKSYHEGAHIVIYSVLVGDKILKYGGPVMQNWRVISSTKQNI